MRLLVGALIVCLVAVPVFVRATRTFDPSGRPSIALSFKKSFDAPPHIAEVPPDLTVSPLAVVEYRIAAPVSLQDNTSSPRAVEALRGPPSPFRS